MHRCRPGTAAGPRMHHRHAAARPLAVWLLCLALAGRACEEAAAARTTCQLVLEGHGDGRVGLSRASLACSPASPQVAVGINTTLLGTAAAGFSGVRVKAVEDLRCQERAEQGRSGHAWRVLLFFCGAPDSDVLLLRPLVRGVVLDEPAAGADALAPSTSSSALLAFGSDVRARIEGGDISDNTAGAALLLLNSARLGLDGTRVSGNTCGSGGAAVMAMQQAQLRVANSSLVGNTATWSGGALHVRDGASATIQDSTVAHNTVRRGHAGGVAADGSAVVRISRSSITNNTAPRDGGGFMAAGAVSVSISGCIIANNTAGTDGGGIAAEEFVVLNVTDSEITGNKASTAGGGVGVHGMAEVMLLNTSIANNSVSATLGRGGGVAVSQSARVMLEDSSVAANTADSGGGIAAGGTSTVRLAGDTRVLDNTALLWGGGLSLDDDARLEVAAADTPRISISGNTARDGGGMYLGSTHFVPDAVRQITSSNSAANEDNLSVEPTLLLILTNTTVRNFTSRVSADKGVLPVRLRVSGWHGFVCEGRLVQAELLTAVPGSGQTARQQLGANASAPDGIVSMDLKFRRPPGVYSIIFKVPSGPAVRPAEMQVEVRPCVAGEVTTSSPEARNDACSLCVAGRFSLNPLNATCDVCPSHASCAGGDDITPLPGWWHSDPASIQIHRCANPDACEGNRTLLQECKQADAGSASLPAACSQPDAAVVLQCSAGYRGNLCGRCAPGYSAAWSPFSCQRCMEKSAVIGIYVVASLLLLGAVKIVCWITLVEGVRDARAYASGAAAGGPLPAASARLRCSDLIKPAVLWAQWLLLLFSMNVAWPASLVVPLRALAWLWSSSAPGQTLSLDCLLSSSTAVPVPVQRLLLCICMPVLVAAALQLIEVCSSRLRCHTWRRRQLRRRRGDDDDGADGDVVGDVDVLATHQGRHYFVALAIVTGYFFLPTVARASLSFFVCITLDEPAAPPYVARAVGRWWVHDMQQQCYTGWHARWAFGLGVPLVFLLFCVLPCGLLFLLVHHRHRLHDPECVHYAFLMRSYKSRCFAWEVVVVVQTLSLVAISSWGYTLGSFYQVLIMSFALAVICVVLLVVQPHAHALAARAARGCALCLLLTSYVTMSFLGPYKDATVNNAYGMSMGVVLIIINVAYLAFLLGALLRMVDWQQVRQWLAGASASCRSRRQGAADGAAAPGSASAPSASKSDLA